MGRINKPNKTTPVSADEFIIYDSEDTSDDKNVTLGQIATFTESQDSTVSGTKIFADGVQFEKGNISFGQYSPLPTTVGSYVASYVSATYGPRLLGYNGTAYQDLSIGSMPTAGTVSMKSLANGDCNFGYNVNIAEDLGVTGDVTANKFIGDGSELTNIAGALKTEALGTVTSDVMLKDGYISTAHANGTLAIVLPTALSSGIENVSVFDFTTGSTSQPTITNSRDLTGTCAVTNGDATVTGTSTLFLTELEVGSKITIATVDYQVLSIASNTSLELTAVYAGTNASGLTVGHKFIKWSSLNGGKAPTAYSVISGVRNILVFKTHNSGITWEAEYTTYGGVETTFVQTALSADGTLGGSSFAVYSNSVYSSDYQTYKAVDNNSSTFFSSSVATGFYYELYNPKALKVSSIDITNYSSSCVITGYTIYGSNDGSSWTALKTGSNNITTASGLWTIALNSSDFYKYHKIYVSTCSGTSAVQLTQVTLNATYIAN